MEASPSLLSSRAKPRDLQFNFRTQRICHPDRSVCRISCHAALERTANAPLRKERRMKFAEATKFHSKSGELRDLLFYGPILEMFFDRGITPELSEVWRVRFVRVRQVSARPPTHHDVAGRSAKSQDWCRTRGQE
jgi:hypothetical protein